MPYVYDQLTIKLSPCHNITYFTGLKAQVTVACTPDDFYQLGINPLSSHNSSLSYISLLIP